jgi:hypothetical protein
MHVRTLRCYPLRIEEKADPLIDPLAHRVGCRFLHQPLREIHAEPANHRVTQNLHESAAAPSAASKLVSHQYQGRVPSTHDGSVLAPCHRDRGCVHHTSASTSGDMRE